MTITRALDGSLTLEFADLAELQAVLRALHNAAYAGKLTCVIPATERPECIDAYDGPRTALDARFMRQRG